MTYPIANGTDLAEKKILEDKVAAEYIYGNALADFFGGDENAVIQQVEELGTGVGQNIIFPFSDAQDPDVGVARGDSTLEGQEQAMRFTSDSLTVDYVRFATKVPNRELGEIRSPIEVFGQAKSKLISQGKEILRNDLLAAAASGLTETNIFTKEGDLVSGATSPLKSRVLFGNDETNYDATLATAVALCDTTNDKMSVAHIRLLKKKAKSMTGTFATATRPRRITPAMVTGRGEDTFSLNEKYVLFLDPRAVLDLQSDSEFKDFRDDSRNNVLANSFINRDLYIGMVENVIIYEMPEMERIAAGLSGASSAQVVQNLFCGAQALGLGWGNRGEFRDRLEDYGKDVGVAWHSIRGQKRISYTDKDSNVINAGMIHSFTATSN